MIICPECEMISPLEADDEAETTLGLGLRTEALQLSSLDGEEEGNRLFEETIVEKLKTCTFKRDPDEDSLSS